MRKNRLPGNFNACEPRLLLAASPNLDASIAAADSQIVESSGVSQATAAIPANPANPATSPSATNQAGGKGDNNNGPAAYLDVIDQLPQGIDSAPDKISIPKEFDSYFDAAQTQTNDGRERGGYISEASNGKLSLTSAEPGTGNSVQLNDTKLQSQAREQGTIVADFHTHPGERDADGKLLPQYADQIPPGGADFGFSSDSTTPGSFVRSAEGSTYLILDTKQTDQNWAQSNAATEFNNLLNNRYNELRQAAIDAGSKQGSGAQSEYKLSDKQLHDIREKSLRHAAISTANQAQSAIYLGGPGATTLTRLNG